MKILFELRRDDGTVLYRFAGDALERFIVSLSSAAPREGNAVLMGFTYDPKVGEIDSHDYEIAAVSSSD